MNKQETQPGTSVKPTDQQNSQNTQEKFNEFVNKWEKEFTEKIEQAVKSRKDVFTLTDAIKKSTTRDRRTHFDSVMIEFIDFINKNPLRNNDYFKYLNSYKQGKKLDIEYFRHDKELLYELYSKIDKDPEHAPFSVNMWKRYVLFMLLKFNGLYNAEEMDDVFGVSYSGHREYNPVTNLSRPLRGTLPSSLKLMCYDISRAVPSFIDNELGIDRKEDVYQLAGKNAFLVALNLHKDNKGATIEKVRKQLEPAYGDRVCEVVTEERFNNPGAMFDHFTKIEKYFIEKFVEVNGIERYARLHDEVIVPADTSVEVLEFGVFNGIKFKKEELKPPKILNAKKPFYKIDDKGQLITEAVKYKEFFEQENFIRVSIPGDDNITVFKDTNKVVKPLNYKTDIVSFLKSKINEFETSEIENRLAEENNTIVRNSLCLLDPLPLVYYRDRKDTFGLPFKNGFVEYRKGVESLEIKKYEDVPGFFPEHITQEKKFSLIHEEGRKPCEFERFLSMVSVNKDVLNEKLTDTEEETFFKFCRMFGYLIHTYKDPSFSPSIVLSDHNADDNNRNGGRGKTIISNAIGFVQKTITKGGNEFDGGYRHRFADLDESHKVYVIDDVPASFNFDNLYTNIIGSISVEPKGFKARTIKFKDTPKFLITTNWAVRYDENAASTNRRFIEFKLTDYFNIDHTPKDVFGHSLFDEWNPEEWNRFYNFSFACVGAYLELGLEKPEYDKETDNFRAYFYNDTLLEEFERIFRDVKLKEDGFSVRDFLIEYHTADYSIRNERFFTTRNVKTLVNTYLKYNQIEFTYRKDVRKWFIHEKGETSNENKRTHHVKSAPSSIEDDLPY